MIFADLLSGSGSSMKKKVLFAVLMLQICHFAGGQNEAQISQYMFYEESFNPASIGQNTMMSASGIFRPQWIGMTNAPRTWYAAFSVPIKKNAVGIIYSGDKAGLFLMQSAVMQYARVFRVGKGKLIGGIEAGFLDHSFDTKGVNDSISSEYHEMRSDPAIPRVKEEAVGMAFDLSAGIYYVDASKYLGISVRHLTAPKFVWQNNVKPYYPQVMYVTGGYMLPIPKNPKFVMKPSFLLKTDFISWQAEVNAMVEYSERMWGGLGYRFQDAVIFMFGLQLFNGLTLTCAVDMPTSKLIATANFTIEVTMRYNFNIALNRANKHKSVRIL